MIVSLTNPAKLASSSQWDVACCYDLVGSDRDAIRRFQILDLLIRQITNLFTNAELIVDDFFEKIQETKIDANVTNTKNPLKKARRIIFVEYVSKTG